MAKWTVHVCRKFTYTDGRIDLQAGPSHDDNDVFATWRREHPQDVFDLPERIQELGRIYFQVNTSKGGESRLCVKFEGAPKKNYRITSAGHHQDMIDASDSNDHCLC